jgi:archaemetzincin
MDEQVFQEERSMNGAIALVSLGRVSPSIIENIRDAAETAFGEEITIIEERSKREEFGGVQRSAASDVIKRLYPFRIEFERVLGVTNTDLSHPGVNHVFGFADPESRVSVISLYRFCTKGAAPGKIAGRAVKTAIHELGHTYGLSHCTEHRCVMFLSFNLTDTDYKKREFCSKCRDEIYSRLENRSRKRECRTMTR